MKRTMIPLMALLGGAPALALAAETSNTPATNAPSSGSEAQCPHAMGEKMAGKLGLDAQATAKFDQTNEKFREQMKPVWQDARQTQDALKQELAKPQPDSTKLTSLSDQLTNDHQKLVSLQQQKLSALKSELTPEQYAQFLVNRGEVARGMFHHGMGESAGESTAPTPSY
ncbi:MAG: periplasmic heavy metal sensor [Deltaproteobacteria bacterium]|nr:periplasmic heavy metal sensor [Deltaproteobacteria bacterium]